jgi:two-component system sensor histidine kinase MtrB
VGQGVSGIRLENWRTWPARAVRSWRRSLQFRTIVVTLALSLFALLISSFYMAITIGNDLFQSRVTQVQQDSARAIESAQNILDSSSDAGRGSTQELMGAAREEIARTSSSTMIAGYRAPGQEPSSAGPQDFENVRLKDVVSDELRRLVQNNPDEQWWQSVSLPTADGSQAPGIVVGSQIALPDASRWEIYIGFDLSDTEQTLLFVQRTLFVGGLALLLLVGAVAWVIVRLVANPVRVAADTSERLASGDLAVRIPVRGEDELATLARSFNRMADSLQSQIRELADLSQVQQRFVSDVSHELRTPLTTIRLAGDVLYDQRFEFPSATARTAELLHTQTQRFEALLADLLEISRYDAGSVELETEPHSLVHLAEDSIDGMASLAEQKGSDVRLVAPGGYSDVEIDPRRIRRVVRNLLGNAIEHGEGRPIVVTVDSNEQAVALSVRDYGHGMTEADAQRVFDRFWRADPSRRRTIGGTGLGLAIALEDAQLHGGSLEVWSRVAGGSCFRLTLPRVLGGEVTMSPLPLPPEDADRDPRQGDPTDAPAQVEPDATRNEKGVGV